MMTTPKEFLAEFRRARALFPDVPTPPMRVKFLMGKRRRLMAHAFPDGRIEIVWQRYTQLSLEGRIALLRHEIAHVICEAMERSLNLDPLPEDSKETQDGHSARWQRIARQLGGHCQRFFDPDVYRA